MLFSLSGLTTSVILMVFSLCTLLKDGYSASFTTASGLSAVVAFLVFGGLYFVLNSRVRAQEIKQPAVLQHKARTVFYVLASIAAFSWFTGFVVTALYYLLSPLAVKGASYGDSFFTVFLPAIIAADIIALAYLSIAKSASSRYVTKFANMALLVGLIVAIATISVAAAKKDAKPTLKSGEKCTYSNYDLGKCSYDEYQDYVDDQYPSRYRSTSPTSDYEEYQEDNELDDSLPNLYDY